ncbi:hypothetical protein MY3296_002108 [Beauveria thailandica]
MLTEYLELLLSTHQCDTDCLWGFVFVTLLGHAAFLIPPVTGADDSAVAVLVVDVISGPRSHESE